MKATMASHENNMDRQKYRYSNGTNGQTSSRKTKWPVFSQF